MLMNLVNLYLEGLGWDYMQTGPDTWKWIKFDKHGHQIAVEGDRVWKQDREAFAMAVLC